MPVKYPLIRLSKESGEKPRQGRKGGRYQPPPKIPYQVQLDRLGSIFDRADVAISNWGKNTQATTDPRTVVPERVLVFELKTEVRAFIDAAHKLGFEWLSSEISPDPSNDEPDQTGLSINDVKAERMYLTMPSLRGLQSLLAQWNRYSDGLDPPHEDSRVIWELFGYLVNLRRWSVQDRIDPLLRSYVERALEGAANTPVLVEIDLWYRATLKQRDEARNTLEELVQEVGGELYDLVTIEEIRYQGALVLLPPQAARRLLLVDDSNRLGGLDEIMAIRPQSGFVSNGTAEISDKNSILLSQAPVKPCISAMLDGYPVEEHDAISRHIIVKEVDVTAEMVPVASRYHGTAMASLIINGDMHESAPAISRPLLALPILSDRGRASESTPARLLPIGVVYRALLAIVREAAGENSKYRNLVVVNHSICDVFAPFTRRPSAWAMLLDHFSYKYNFLFVISAGNISEGLSIPGFDSVAELMAATPEQRQAAFMVAVEREKARRGIYSPAESMNNLTIGALHSDASSSTSNLPDRLIDPFPLSLMPSLTSAIGHGINESIKPDLMEVGGRVAAVCSNAPDGGIVAKAQPSTEMGQLVAAPSLIGDLSKLTRISGTSNAAALITRKCHFIADALDEVYSEESTNWSLRKTRAPLLKALLTHGARWGGIGEIMEKSFPPHEKKDDWRPRRSTISRFIGYGYLKISRALTGAHSRATLVAEDILKAGKQHVYRVPLPSSMINNKELRAITITLAWTSPVMPYADYRGVRLAVLSSDRSQNFWEGVGRAGGLLQPDYHAVGRGTLTHIRLQGRKARSSVGPDGLYFGIHATANHKSFSEIEVPYALVVSLEMGVSTRAPIHEEVQAALRARTSTRSRIR